MPYKQTQSWFWSIYQLPSFLRLALGLLDLTCSAKWTPMRRQIWGTSSLGMQHLQSPVVQFSLTSKWLPLKELSSTNQAATTSLWHWIGSQPTKQHPSLLACITWMRRQHATIVGSMPRLFRPWSQQRLHSVHSTTTLRSLFWLLMVCILQFVSPVPSRAPSGTLTSLMDQHLFMKLLLQSERTDLSGSMVPLKHQNMTRQSTRSPMVSKAKCLKESWVLPTDFTAWGAYSCCQKWTWYWWSERL